MTEQQKQDRARARGMLRHYFGRPEGRPYSPEDREQIECWRQSPGENELDILQRVGGDNYNWRAERSWDKRALHFSRLY